MIQTKSSRETTDFSTSMSTVSRFSAKNAANVHSSTMTMDVEDQQLPLVVETPDKKKDKDIIASGNSGGSGGISSMGYKVLLLLAVQNSSKNLLMRHVMKEKPKFLPSAAVVGSECTKLSLSLLYILLVEKKSFSTIVQYFRDNVRTTLLVLVPASAYNLQLTLEYIALANMDAAMFSVLVQSKLVCTATFSVLVLGKKLRYIQVISLTLLTVGIMLCNMKVGNNNDDANQEAISNTKGILATLGIAVSSGFASVYTEKVIKAPQRRNNPSSSAANNQQYSLAYTQVQLATMSLVAVGVYVLIMDFKPILENGLFYNFNGMAFLTVFNSAIGGLIVAGVLKYADSVLKGYATAISVIGTGLLSMVLFGTKLHAVYFMGVINVVIAVLLYNGQNFHKNMC